MSARIVVADDDADIRRLVAFVLRRRGHEVLEATSGDAALALVRRELPDLLVLDVMMPGLSGLDVARELANDAATAGIPIVMLSARGQASEVKAGLKSGACAYLVKPFTPHELADRVGELLGATRREG